MFSHDLAAFREAEEFLKGKFGIGFNPEWALVLGSGLDEIARQALKMISIPYSEIPGFSVPSVAGHAGNLIVCDLFGKKTLVFSGRFHFYEGYSMSQVIFPVRLAALLGCQHILLTAAVGGLNKKFRPGDIVVVKDHMNFCLLYTSPSPRD